MNVNSTMKISIIFMAWFLTQGACMEPIEVKQVSPKCIVNVPESAKETFINKIENGKKVIFFEIIYDSKQANLLTKPEKDNYFANPNQYMWVFDGDNGLPIYMNAPYDFSLLSFFILDEYTSKLIVKMNVSQSCNKSVVTREEFLRLVYQQLIKIVLKAPLPDKKASTYFCYDINSKKQLSDESFLAYKRLGMNREVLQKYCCQVKEDKIKDKDSTNLCSGQVIHFSKTLNLENYIGAIIFAFFPLLIGFISSAKLPGIRQRFQYIRLISGNFHKGEQFTFPFGTESSWINENDDHYTFVYFLKYILLFNHSSLIASRFRRSLSVFLSTIILFLTIIGEYIIFHNQLNQYLHNNIPLGIYSLPFGYKSSAQNTDYFLGGPYVWFCGYIILNMILINIPERLCKTISHCIFYQTQTCTFLFQDITFFERYGELNVTNLYDYPLLHAILKSGLLTALNPSFWKTVVKRWIQRCKNVFNYFDNTKIISQLIAVCITFVCAIISFGLGTLELLFCIIYYGCPQLMLWKMIFHSYTLKYIVPLLTNGNFIYKVAGFLLFLAFIPIYVLMLLYSIYLFLTTFQVISAYALYTVIALIAKPDAIAYVLLILSFVYFAVSIIKSISETYQSLMKVSIKLAESVFQDFVYTRLGESFIYADLFHYIVQKHHPIRMEVAKTIMKFTLMSLVFISCVYSFDGINLNLSTYIKIGLIILTTMIPKITTVLKDPLLLSRWKIERILKTIYIYKTEVFDRQIN